jgi:hypothetical protein
LLSGSEGTKLSPRTARNERSHAGARSPLRRVRARHHVWRAPPPWPPESPFPHQARAVRVVVRHRADSRCARREGTRTRGPAPRSPGSRSIDKRRAASNPAARTTASYAGAQIVYRSRFHIMQVLAGDLRIALRRLAWVGRQPGAGIFPHTAGTYFPQGPAFAQERSIRSASSTSSALTFGGGERNARVLDRRRRFEAASTSALRSSASMARLAQAELVARLTARCEWRSTSRTGAVQRCRPRPGQQAALRWS